MRERECVSVCEAELWRWFECRVLQISVIDAPQTLGQSHFNSWWFHKHLVSHRPYTPAFLITILSLSSSPFLSDPTEALGMSGASASLKVWCDLMCNLWSLQHFSRHTHTLDPHTSTPSLRRSASELWPLPQWPRVGEGQTPGVSRGHDRVTHNWGTSSMSRWEKLIWWGTAVSVYLQVKVQVKTSRDTSVRQFVPLTPPLSHHALDQTSAHAHTHSSNKLTHSLTNTHTQTHRLSHNTQTLSHKHTTHTLTLFQNKGTHSHKPHTLKNTLSHTHIQTHSLFQTKEHTLTNTHSLTNTYTNIQTHTHTHTLSHKHIHKHSNTHTHTQHQWISYRRRT